jgi:3-oxoacyl-[acyl-carrier-protein] synthase-3
VLQDKLGAKGAWGFDLSAACSGFLYALATGAQFIISGVHKRVLVVGADVMSSIINYEDRATCVIFGDGAGAVLLEPSESESEGVLDFLHEVDGSGGQFLQMPAGGSRLPSSEETVKQKLHYVHQDGPQVFKFAVRKMYEVCQAILERNGLTGADVDVFIPHQASRRIIDATRERLGMNCDKVLINIDRYGNTTAATIPLATADAIHEGKLRKGSLVLYAAAGAGYTVGASLVRWAY